ncbi:MAG: riboflavin synthase [Rhodothermales bacterium]|nr:riboflavin synthase [Rhodothermales bacterium]MBO6778994.1 riboflavin synthase [Rhodothermales bacterium]
MFTGIVETVGRVAAVTPQGGGVRLRIDTPFAGELRVDESVCVSGACQTVVAQDATSFEVVAVEETLAKTNLASLKAGSPVNLERALKMGGRLDGHLVQGHVDTTGTVTDVQQLETSWLCSVQFDDAFGPYVIPVGSICLDGISLTVARLEGSRLTVAVIPHTWENTTISNWKPGSTVNMEFDMVGKYVVRFLEQQKSPPTPGMTASWLREQGF